MIDEVVKKYLQFYPEDKSLLKRLIDQLKSKERLDDRQNFRGHIAGDAVIFSPDLTKILYIYHLRFGKWQQPGGHLDPGEDGPWITAPREAIEETGVRVGSIVGPDKRDLRVPLLIVTGPVPPSKKKNEPEHWHHDFRYGMIAETEKLDPIDDEGVGEARWWPINEALKIPDNDHNWHKSINRMQELLTTLKA